MRMFRGDISPVRRSSPALERARVRTAGQESHPACLRLRSLGPVVGRHVWFRQFSAPTTRSHPRCERWKCRTVHDAVFVRTTGCWTTRAPTFLTVRSKIMNHWPLIGRLPRAGTRARVRRRLL
jgi:hypothetical protein